MSSEASTLSIALFDAMDALLCAEAQLYEKPRDDAGNVSSIVATLLHATRVVHAACEAALTRVEPMYDAHVNARDAAEHVACKDMVATALLNASTVVSALEYASTQVFDGSCSRITPCLRPADLCSEAAMREAIDAGSIGAVALGIVCLESAQFPPPRGLFISVLQTATVNCLILRLLLSSSALQTTMIDRDIENYTALMRASQTGHTEAVTLLLACPAVIKLAGAVNDAGDTALMLAAKFGHADTIIELIACPEISATARVVDAGGETTLMLAVRSKRVESVSALLACLQISASANVTNTFGDTALLIASRRGESTQMIAALLACPMVAATATMANDNGHTALMFATFHGNFQIVSALLSDPIVAASACEADETGFSALMYASQHGYTLIVTALLGCSSVAKSASIFNENEQTALMIACIAGRTDTVVALLQCPEVNMTAGICNRWYGYTALMYASQHGHTQIVTTLLTCSAVTKSLDDINCDGNTALMIASKKGHTEVVTAFDTFVRSH